MESPQTFDRQRAEQVRLRQERLREAFLRINQNLDFDPVLKAVVDSARALTDCRCSALVLHDEVGGVEKFVISGLSVQELKSAILMKEARQLFGLWLGISETLRIKDFGEHVASLGHKGLRMPLPLPETHAMLISPVFVSGQAIGHIFLGGWGPGAQFSQSDVETIENFAAVVGVTIANARRHRDLLRSRADLESVIDMSPIGVVVIDIDGRRVTVANHEARRIAGSLVQQGQAPDTFLDALGLAPPCNAENPSQKSGQAAILGVAASIRAEEIELRDSQGASLPVLVNATPIHSDQGRVETLLVTLQDMTPLGELERMRNEFLGMVGHELRTPLTSIKGSAATLLDESNDLGPDEVREFHKIIIEQADHMRSMIGDLLDVTRIETGTLSVAPAPETIGNLIHEARGRFISGGNLNRIDLEITPNLPPVMVDRRRLIQVIGNLLENAARYSADSAPIGVQAIGSGVFVEVSIHDCGMGIPPEQLPHLFRKYFRQAGTNGGQDTRSSGIGLAICKGVIEAHGGRIWAESDGSGMGSRFRFTVPVVDVAALDSVPIRATEHKNSMPEVRVLAIDDDPQALHYIRLALDAGGFVPIVTGDPGEALAILEQQDPGLVLLDLKLPGVDGIDLMQQMRGISDAPVIFISAYGQDELIARAFELGADDYVVKPFSPTELVSRIRAALRRQAGPLLLGTTGSYFVGDLSINFAERRVEIDGNQIHLTPNEYSLLRVLAIGAGRVVSHEQLLRRVWGDKNRSGAPAVRTQMRRLRQKLGDSARNPRYIHTSPRRGYRLARDGDAY